MSSFMRIIRVSALLIRRQTRSMGITDKIMGFASNKMEANKDKQFENMIQAMVNQTQPWSLKTWKGTLEEQLSSWLMYIPGMSSTMDTAKLKSYKG